VAHALVAAIEPDGVTDVEPLHRLGEIGLGGFGQQMIMIGHEHVQAQAEAIHPLGEQLQEVVAVTVVAEGEALFIAARRQVIPQTGALRASPSSQMSIVQS